MDVRFPSIPATLQPGRMTFGNNPKKLTEPAFLDLFSPEAVAQKGDALIVAAIQDKDYLKAMTLLRSYYLDAKKLTPENVKVLRYHFRQANGYLVENPAIVEKHLLKALQEIPELKHLYPAWQKLEQESVLNAKNQETAMAFQTGKYATVIENLESFYQLRISSDSRRQFQKHLEIAKNCQTSNPGQVSSQLFKLFELPELDGIYKLLITV